MKGPNIIDKILDFASGENIFPEYVNPREYKRLNIEII